MLGKTQVRNRDGKGGGCALWFWVFHKHTSRAGATTILCGCCSKMQSPLPGFLAFRCLPSRWDRGAAVDVVSPNRRSGLFPSTCAVVCAFVCARVYAFVCVCWRNEYTTAGPESDGQREET